MFLFVLDTETRRCPTISGAVLFAENAGHKHRGCVKNVRLHVDLWGMPVFAGLNGPMRDGEDENGLPVIRYESPAVTRVVASD